MDAKQRAEQITEPVTLDIVLQIWPGRVIPEVGHVGYSPTATMIQLTFDPANPNFDANLGERLCRTVAHELHHCLRWDGPGYGTTVGEVLVSEGLACLFPHQLYGHEPEPWEQVNSDFDVLALIDRALAEWSEPIDAHIAWFRGGDGLPSRAVYSVGTWIVANRIAEWGEDATPANLASLPAEKFR